jgi:hypothetical protein
MMLFQLHRFSNGTMIVNDKLRKIRNESVLAYFKVLIQQLSGGEGGGLGKTFKY